MGWIEYFRQLNDHGDIRYEQVLNELYEKVRSGVEFRDKEDLYRELGDEYNTLDNQDRADFFYGLEDNEKAIARITYRSQSFHKEAFRVITEHEEEAKPYLRESLEKSDTGKNGSG